MTPEKRKIIKKIKRKKRVKAKIKSNKDVLRLSIFRGNKNLFAQIIDDSERITRVSASTTENGFSEKENKSNIDSAKKLGKLIADRAVEKSILKVVFDRGGLRYHGKIKAFAEAARENGLKF
jgi:large subunit ribosomal protein L18